MIYEAHTLNEEIGQVFDIENILSITLKKDKLAKSLQDWDTVLAGQIGLLAHFRHGGGLPRNCHNIRFNDAIV
jgi:hypothetical protein